MTAWIDTELDWWQKDSSRHSIDYDDTFCLVVKMATIHIVLSISISR
jgi:hypothetical protein